MKQILRTTLITLIGLVALVIVYPPHKPQNVRSGLYIVHSSKNPIGTAFKIGENKLITAKHVCEALGDTEDSYIGNHSMSVRLSDIVMVHTITLDICILRTPMPVEGYTFKLSDKKIGKYQTVYSYGFPGAKYPVKIVESIVTKPHYISAQFYFDGEPLYSEYFIVGNQPIIHGMSGGPLLNKDGLVIGVNARTTDENGFYAPIYQVKEWIDEQ